MNTHSSTPPHRRAPTKSQDSLTLAWAAAFRAERLRQGWSETALAGKAGVAPATVCNIEKGVHSPKLGVTARLCAALKVGDDLMMRRATRRRARGDLVI